MVEMKTEQIKCILCNKQLNLLMRDGKELFLCSECQAYFCPNCLNTIKNYRFCPAAKLLGSKEHSLKLLKFLPPKLNLTTQTDREKKQSTISIIPEKTIKIIDESTKKQQKTKLQ